jgi:hypothetical protein
MGLLCCPSIIFLFLSYMQQPVVRTADDVRAAAGLSALRRSHADLFLRCLRSGRPTGRSHPATAAVGRSSPAASPHQPTPAHTGRVFIPCWDCSSSSSPPAWGQHITHAPWPVSGNRTACSVHVGCVSEQCSTQCTVCACLQPLSDTPARAVFRYSSHSMPGPSCHTQRQASLSAGTRLASSSRTLSTRDTMERAYLQAS